MQSFIEFFKLSEGGGGGGYIQNAMKFALHFYIQKIMHFALRFI